MTAGTLPNFIVVGASQAGTAALFDALSQHPQICPSSIRETRYFQPSRYDEPLRPLAEYSAHFRRYTNEPVVMECTPDYYYGGRRTAVAIKDACDPRVTVVLRDPVERLVAFYRFMQNRLQIPKDMTLRDYLARCQIVPEAAMDTRDATPFTGVWAGQYARQLPSWLETFRGRIDIFFFEDLASHPEVVIAEQCRRLGVEPLDRVDTDPPPARTSIGWRSPGAQRIAAFTADRSQSLFRRYPTLYTRSRRIYEAANQRYGSHSPVAAHTRREIAAIYQPWNELLAQQLREAGQSQLPSWLSQ